MEEGLSLRIRFFELAPLHLHLFLSLSRSADHRMYYRMFECNKYSSYQLIFRDGPDEPEHLLCPITHCLMRDPVITFYGHTYERHAFGFQQCLQIGYVSVLHMHELG